MTLADFLAWEAQQETRHEFVDGEVFAMTGARPYSPHTLGDIITLADPPCRLAVAEIEDSVLELLSDDPDE